MVEDENERDRFWRFFYDKYGLPEVANESFAPCPLEEAKRIVQLLDDYISSYDEDRNNARYRARQKAHDDFWKQKNWAAEKAARDKSGFVYLLHGGGFYKIGQSKNTNSRIKGLGTKSPFVITKIAERLTDDMDRDERLWHAKFANHRTNGEWFDLSEAQVQEFKAWSASAEEATQE